MDRVTRQCPQTTAFLKRKESRSGIEPRSFRLPASRLTARPNRLRAVCRGSERYVYLPARGRTPRKLSGWTHGGEPETVRHVWQSAPGHAHAHSQRVTRSLHCQWVTPVTGSFGHSTVSGSLHIQRVTRSLTVNGSFGHSIVSGSLHSQWVTRSLHSQWVTRSLHSQWVTRSLHCQWDTP